ncbi:LPXTG cell wall anchor domain-containing protein [Rathayibacter sp. ZW T2_19]|uniref:LPXTG cell wall anchor domain-containing protein n=1 Tax=Rathayibacter rubneri TaxID=2950106 RepID=A0A9X2E0J4_9MICO|nr:LPXTG cell wall anchor domain-containing protein [Rathayibacter rubneri]MCM6763188.1 LPXTG cell wall anchor domain-containing protein [Rathayibacter rubneri]
MNRSDRPLLRGTLTAATVLGLSLAGAATASAENPSDWEDGIHADGGALVVDAGPEYAGYDVLVQAQLPLGAGRGAGVWIVKKASLDVQGDATVLNFSGPVNLYFSSPSAVDSEPELAEPAATAAIYRGATIEYDVDPAAGTAVVDGVVPEPEIPTLSGLQYTVSTFARSSVAPSSYVVGEDFDLVVSDLQWATQGDLDGLATRTMIYSEPTLLGSSTVTDGTVVQTVPAEYTDEPHTVALFDVYGRLLASATLDGGAAATPGTTPTAAPTTPAAAAPVAHSGAKPGSRTGAHLAETGVETGAGALLAGLLLAAGAGGLVVARRRGARA